ncbi:hypothetical protein [Aquibium oceanicum]|uniref:hypothetical protein n=1 Tax=Aquibium oceanicum TaxID=1670800 RepID=UPI000AE6900F|nr:hypothetical protein [Aquibium oceanicum]
MFPVTAFGLFVEGLTRFHDPASRAGTRVPERHREQHTAYRRERLFRNHPRV